MDINERLKQIDDFFEDLSIEEFEEKLEKAGINNIKSCSNSNMEMLLSPTCFTESDEIR